MKDYLINAMTQAMLDEDSTDYRNAKAMLRVLNENIDIYEQVLNREEQFEIIKEIHAQCVLYGTHEEFEEFKPNELKNMRKYIAENIKGRKVTVYRGISDFNNNFEKGNCWTIDYEIARWFAHRGNNPKVLEMVVNRADILFYTNQRNEQEVYLQDRFIKNYKVIEL